MTFQWNFRPKHRGDDIADPISGEFFADGSLDNPATALVRESLQNALDAGEKVDRGGAPVHVRICVRRNAHAASRESAEQWFGTLREHIDADGNGLRDGPVAGEPCDYLVIEDFGTTGLTGDIESDDADGDRNNFVDFLRSDGRTRKDQGDRGSWGVGKNVFPRSSRINGFIAFTVRDDDGRQLVMGKTILKIRRVGDQQYQPPCYLGTSWDAGDVPRPYEDAAVVKQLREAFSLRRNAEPGLSLVIPWLDADVRYEDIERAVVEQFYYAILRGGLSVTLADGANEFTLDESSIVDRVREYLPDQLPAVELAEWSMSVPDEERLVLEAPASNDPQQWSLENVPAEVRERVSDRLARRERVAVRVPLHVFPARASVPIPSHFDLYLEHHDFNTSIRPSFFREQLAISGVKRAVPVPRIRPLVVVDHEPLATLLRAAEPPNHTDWDMKTANFRKAYRNGNHVITFVKSAVKQFMSIVRAGDEEPDPTVAIDFFALPEPDPRPAPPGGKRKKKPGDDTPPKPEPPSRSPRRFKIDAVEGGFVVRPGEPGTVPPRRINVQMAYDVMSGSPWKHYEKADFDLSRKDRSGIQIASSGAAEVHVRETNRIQVQVTGEDFEVFITGFDVNRDLIVRAYDPKEPVHADPAAELHEA